MPPEVLTNLFQDKCDLRLERGLGEKLLLRGLAFNLGLRDVAFEPKRAIQFGSRIARMENRYLKKRKKGKKKEKKDNMYQRNTLIPFYIGS